MAPLRNPRPPGQAGRDGGPPGVAVRAPGLRRARLFGAGPPGGLLGMFGDARRVRALSIMCALVLALQLTVGRGPKQSGCSSPSGAGRWGR